MPKIYRKNVGISKFKDRESQWLTVERTSFSERCSRYFFAVPFSIHSDINIGYPEFSNIYPSKASTLRCLSFDHT